MKHTKHRERWSMAYRFEIMGWRDVWPDKLMDYEWSYIAEYFTHE